MLWPLTRPTTDAPRFPESASSTAARQTYPSARNPSSGKPRPKASGEGKVLVALIADSGGLYALYDRRDRHHAAVKDALQGELGPIILPAAALAEIDYLLRTKLGL